MPESLFNKVTGQGTLMVYSHEMCTLQVNADKLQREVLNSWLGYINRIFGILHLRLLVRAKNTLGFLGCFKACVTLC